MKKLNLNGNAPSVQLLTFIIMLIYFLVFSQGYIKAESQRCAKEVVLTEQQKIIERGEERSQDIQEIKINLKQLCDRLDVHYIEK